MKIVHLSHHMKYHTIISVLVKFETILLNKNNRKNKKNKRECMVFHGDAAQVLHTFFVFFGVLNGCNSVNINPNTLKLSNFTNFSMLFLVLVSVF